MTRFFIQTTALTFACSLIVLISPQAYSQIKIKRKSSVVRKLASSDHKLAKIALESFFKCGDSFKPENKKKYKELQACTTLYTSEKMSEYRAQQYLELFYSSLELTEPYRCSHKTEVFLKSIENDWKVVLCFGVVGVNEPTIGYAFFVEEKGFLKLKKLKF